MNLVATLISSPAAPSVTEVLARKAFAYLPGYEMRVLHEGVAVDGLFDAGNVEDPNVAPLGLEVLIHDYRNAMLAELGGAPIDIVIQPVANRRKKLFLADMDSTMIQQECIDELADYVGLKKEVSAITERAMRGELPFEPALRERVALLKGLPLSVIDEIIESRITLMPGGRELVATMRANGTYCALVSGGFTLFTGPIAGMFGFQEHRSNRLIIEDEKLAGRVEEPIVGREAKYEALVELREKLGLAEEETLAVGDGANDLAMLGEAGLGVAYHAKPAVAEAAAARVDHGDLSALLYMQGYGVGEIVGAVN
jgi:phosphoserine phosphatase